MVDDLVPGWARLRHVRLDFDLMERKANASSQQQIAEDDVSMREWSTTITW